MSPGKLALGVAMLVPILLGAASPAPAQTACPVEVRIDCVLATDTHEGIDSRLQSMSRHLSQSFHYSTFRLVSHQVEKTRCGQQVAFSLPGGRILHVEPRGLEGNMIAMELVLFQGERPMMTTDVKLKNRGVLMVGGPRYEQGMLIISIGAESPPLPRPAAGSHSTPR